MAGEEAFHEGIAAIIKQPERNFIENPLSQIELAAVIETLMNEVNDPAVSEELAQFYISVIEFLKPKILLN